MRIATAIMVALALLAGAASLPAVAGSTDPLFVNLLTDENHRAGMALTFGKNQQERGHPLTVFFNDKGVLVASKANAGRFGPQQKLIAELIAKGAVMYACGMCMRHYGVKDSDLMDGVKVSNPNLVGEALFRDHTKTMSW